MEILHEKGQVYNFEAYLVKKDNSQIYVSTNAHFYYNEDGSIAGVEGSIRDITRMKKAQMLSAKVRSYTGFLWSILKTGFLSFKMIL